jgi:hypothetical protein
MSNWNFSFNLSDGTTLNASPNTALVFLDETGDEQLSNPKYRIFGLGGCCVLASDYVKLIDSPWTSIRKEIFGLTNSPFHTTDINFNNKQITALNWFFKSFLFGRFATVASATTEISPQLKLEHIAYITFCNRMLDIIRWTNFEDIIIIYEDSKRLKPKLNHIINTVNIDEDGRNIDISYIAGSKKLMISGLDVADLILHTAGTTVRDLEIRKISKLKQRKDFATIFESVDDRYSSFLYINKVTHNP